MDLPLIEKLLKIVKDSGVAEVEITEDELKVVVRMQPPSAQASPVVAWPPYPAPPYAPPPGSADGSQAPPAASGPAPAPADESAPEPARATVKAPLVGTFYRASAPGEEPFAKVGDVVRKGDTLCIIEAMKLMNEIESEVDGTVAEILVDDALPVEFDQPLFLIET